MQQTKDSRSFLYQQWQAILTSKDAKMIMVGNVDNYKYRSQGNHHIIYNPSLKSKLARSPHDDEKKQKKSVFIPFSSTGYNFSNLPNNQMICHINLDEEQLISRQQSYKITERYFDKPQDQDDKIQSHSHPLYINTSPFCKGHSMLLMYPDEQLPQIVGSDILLLLLNIFNIFPNIKVGYNSLGGAASVNHLHFHLLYSEDLIGEPQMPIQRIKKHQWLKSSLMNPSEQINLYTIGVKIDEIKDFNTRGFILTPYSSEQQMEFAEVTNSLSFVFGIIVNELIELSLPHNILISNNGSTIYIFVRDFVDTKSKNRYGWLQFSGIIPVHDQKIFESLKEGQILENKKNLGIEPEILELVKKNVQNHLSKFI